MSGFSLASGWLVRSTVIQHGLSVVSTGQRGKCQTTSEPVTVDCPTISRTRSVTPRRRDLTIEIERERITSFPVSYPCRPQLPGEPARGSSSTSSFVHAITTFGALSEPWIPAVFVNVTGVDTTSSNPCGSDNPNGMTAPVDDFHVSAISGSDAPAVTSIVGYAIATRRA